MGADSKIEWTHNTFNPWRGCTKVSDGCKNCYAETLSHRNPAVLGVWGDKGTRVIASESMWREPVKWNAAAEKAGERRRVFCASLADVCEDRPDLVEPRRRLMHLISHTHSLDWLLLTKRPENFNRLFNWNEIFYQPHAADRWPENVWVGTTVENQKATARIAELMKVDAAVQFLSCEPLLERVVLPETFLMPDFADDDPRHTKRWVIVGGESGPGARPMHPEWARSLRDQCAAPGVAFFFKQWGEWQVSDVEPGGDLGGDMRRGLARIVHLDAHTDDELCKRSFFKGDAIVRRVGKKAAGRLLDGRLHDEFPEARTQ